MCWFANGIITQLFGKFLVLVLLLLFLSLAQLRWLVFRVYTNWSGFSWFSSQNKVKTSWNLKKIRLGPVGPPNRPGASMHHLVSTNKKWFSVLDIFKGLLQTIQKHPWQQNIQQIRCPHLCKQPLQIGRPFDHPCGASEEGERPAETPPNCTWRNCPSGEAELIFSNGAYIQPTSFLKRCYINIYKYYIQHNLTNFLFMLNVVIHIEMYVPISKYHQRVNGPWWDLMWTSFLPVQVDTASGESHGVANWHPSLVFVGVSRLM